MLLPKSEKEVLMEVYCFFLSNNLVVSYQYFLIVSFLLVPIVYWCRRVAFMWSPMKNIYYYHYISSFAETKIEHKMNKVTTFHILMKRIYIFFHLLFIYKSTRRKHPHHPSSHQSFLTLLASSLVSHLSSICSHISTIMT